MLRLKAYIYYLFNTDSYLSLDLLWIYSFRELENMRKMIYIIAI